MDPEKKSLNFIFPTKYVIPKSLSRLAIGQVKISKWLMVPWDLSFSWDPKDRVVGPLPPSKWLFLGFLNGGY